LAADVERFVNSNDFEKSVSESSEDAVEEESDFDGCLY